MSGKKRIISFLLPSFATLLFLSLFIYLSLYRGQALLNDCDTGYHIRAGEFILNSLSIPKHDIFSYHLPPLPWVSHEWLSELIMAAIHKNFGLNGVVFSFILLISFLYFVLFKMIKINSDNLILSVLIILFAVVSSALHWLARPHIYSLLIFVIWYNLLDIYQYRNKNYLFLLPIIVLLWVNLHGGFISGLILNGVYFSGNLLMWLSSKTAEGNRHKKKAEIFGIMTFICLLVSMLNPHGYQILLFPVKLIRENILMDYVREFQSPNFHSVIFKPYEYLLLVSIGIFIAGKEKLNWIELILVLLFTYMSLFSARYIPLFVIIVSPILARKCQGSLQKGEGSVLRFIRKRGRNMAAADAAADGFMWSFVGVILVIVALGRGSIDYEFDRSKKPAAAVDFIEKEFIDGNMFNNDEFGDYIIYRAFPQYKVFIDGRLDIYEGEKVKEYLKVIDFKTGWEEIIEKYRIKWIIFPSDSSLSRYLFERSDWKLIYSDRVANIFVRNIPDYEYLIKKYEDVKPVIASDKDNFLK
jgi:hypothetical protein